MSHPKSSCQSCLRTLLSLQARMGRNMLSDGYNIYYSLRMDIFEAIAKRHSYRGEYTDDSVPESDLRKIVQAGIDAPSGCNAQTTSFVIVNDATVISEISQVINKESVGAAKAIIVTIVDHKQVYRGMSFGPEDCAAAVENMLLAITALGYASVWLDGCLKIEGRARKIAALLNIPDNLEVRVLLPVGVPVKSLQPKEKKKFDERASVNRYLAPDKR